MARVFWAVVSGWLQHRSSTWATAFPWTSPGLSQGVLTTTC